MGKIDLSINKVGLEHNIQKAKENNVIIPTIAQMQHPETIPEKIQAKLKNVGLWDVNPLNLFRITWKNEAKESGGLFQEVPNYVEIPSELVRRTLPHHRHGGQVVPHRLPQGRRFLRLPRSASGHRPVRRQLSPRRLALHRQLLPRRRVQLQAARRATPWPFSPPR